MTSVASYRTAITAFAPCSCACCSIRTNASCRAVSHSSVRRVMLPPTSVCRLAPSVPSTERERTVMARTTPSGFVTRYPSSESAVRLIVWRSAMALAPPAWIAAAAARADAQLFDFARLHVVDVADRQHVIRLLPRLIEARVVMDRDLPRAHHLEAVAVNDDRGRFGQPDSEQ